MARRWMLGLIGAFAAIAVAGIGFAAFTATATVNVVATGGTIGLEITDFAFYGCHFVTGAPGPGTFDSASENAARTAVTFGVGNLTAGDYCQVKVFIMNTGTIPINVTAFLSEIAGICAPAALNCYDAGDSWGLTAFGGIVSTVAPGEPFPPGFVFTDLVSVGIPPGSVSAPPSGVFSVNYVASSGI